MFVAIISFLILSGCKKDITADPPENAYKTKVSSWIENKITAMVDSKENVELLKQNLDYTNMRVEESKRGEKLVVIPLLNGYKNARRLHANTIPNLVVSINTSDNVRNAHIVFFTPENTSLNALPTNAMRNIYTTALEVPDGKYTFLTIKGARLYQLGYNDGKLVSEGVVRLGNNANTSVQASAQTPKASYIFECSDVYLVTSYYDTNGNFLGSDRTYLGRQGNCNGPGENQVPQEDPGGGGNEVPEEYEYAKWRLMPFSLSTLFAIGHATTYGEVTLSIRGENNVFTSASAGTSYAVNILTGWSYTHVSSSATIINTTTISASGKGNFKNNYTLDTYESSKTQNFSYVSVFP